MPSNGMSLSITKSQQVSVIDVATWGWKMLFLEYYSQASIGCFFWPSNTQLGSLLWAALAVFYFASFLGIWWPQQTYHPITLLSWCLSANGVLFQKSDVNTSATYKVADINASLYKAEVIPPAYHFTSVIAIDTQQTATWQHTWINRIILSPRREQENQSAPDAEITAWSHG